MERKKWKICIDEPFLNCEFVYPIQQKKVREILQELKNLPEVKKVIIFGSSVSDKCHIGSDVDVYVESSSPSIRINKYFPFKFDLLTNYSSDERLLKEIYKTGVVVYEKNSA